MVLLYGTERAGDAPSPTAARIRTDLGGEDRMRTPLLNLLRAFHRALAEGHTAGLVVDGLHPIPGDPPTALDPSRSHPPDEASALRMLFIRARTWGRRIAGCVAVPLESPKGLAGVRTVLLRADPRQYLLLWNASDRFVRGEHRLGGDAGGRSWVRAVEVPPDPAAPPGRVVIAEEGVLTFRLDLRPGDAALFELFSGKTVGEGSPEQPRTVAMLAGRYHVRSERDRRREKRSAK